MINPTSMSFLGGAKDYATLDGEFGRHSKEAEENMRKVSLGKIFEYRRVSEESVSLTSRLTGRSVSIGNNTFRHIVLEFWPRVRSPNDYHLSDEDKETLRSLDCLLMGIRKPSSTESCEIHVLFNKFFEKESAPPYVLEGDIMDLPVFVFEDSLKLIYLFIIEEGKIKWNELLCIECMYSKVMLFNDKYNIHANWFCVYMKWDNIKLIPRREGGPTIFADFNSLCYLLITMSELYKADVENDEHKVREVRAVVLSKLCDFCFRGIDKRIHKDDLEWYSGISKQLSRFDPSSTFDLRGKVDGRKKYKWLPDMHLLHVVIWQYLILARALPDVPDQSAAVLRSVMATRAVSDSTLNNEPVIQSPPPSMVRDFFNGNSDGGNTQERGVENVQLCSHMKEVLFTTFVSNMVIVSGLDLYDNKAQTANEIYIFLVSIGVNVEEKAIRGALDDRAIAQNTGQYICAFYIGPFHVAGVQSHGVAPATIFFEASNITSNHTDNVGVSRRRNIILNFQREGITPSDVKANKDDSPVMFVLKLACNMFDIIAVQLRNLEAIFKRIGSTDGVGLVLVHDKHRAANAKGKAKPQVGVDMIVVMVSKAFKSANNILMQHFTGILRELNSKPGVGLGLRDPNICGTLFRNEEEARKGAHSLAAVLDCHSFNRLGGFAEIAIQQESLYFIAGVLSNDPAVPKVVDVFPSYPAVGNSDQTYGIMVIYQGPPRSGGGTMDLFNPMLKFALKPGVPHVKSQGTPKPIPGGKAAEAIASKDTKLLVKPTSAGTPATKSSYRFALTGGIQKTSTTSTPVGAPEPFRQRWFEEGSSHDERNPYLSPSASGNDALLPTTISHQMEAMVRRCVAESVTENNSLKLRQQEETRLLQVSLGALAQQINEDRARYESTEARRCNEKAAEQLKSDFIRMEEKEEAAAIRREERLLFQAELERSSKESERKSMDMMTMLLERLLPTSAPAMGTIAPFPSDSAPMGGVLAPSPVQTSLVATPNEVDNSLRSSSPSSSGGKRSSVASPIREIKSPVKKSKAKSCSPLGLPPFYEE
jgi:hypothetical protein